MLKKYYSGNLKIEGSLGNIHMCETLMLKCILKRGMFSVWTGLNWFRIEFSGKIPIKWYSDSLRVGRSGDRIPVEATFSAPIQTDSDAHPASCTMGTGSSLGARRPERGTDHPPPSTAEVHRKEYSDTSTLPEEAFEAYKKGIKPLAKTSQFLQNDCKLSNL
jgi:hypothetical protein